MLVAKRKGNLDLITGPMFSGKSERTNHVISKLVFARKKFVVFKPQIDTRDDHIGKNVCKTHAGNIIRDVKVIDNPYKMLLYIDDLDYVVIEELQFWSEDVIDIIDYLLNRTCINVVANSLLSDYKSYAIGHAHQLIQHANNLSLTAICTKCQCDDAIYSQLIVREPKVKSQIIIGAENEYEPRCRTCFVFPSEIEEKRNRIANIHMELRRIRDIKPCADSEIKELVRRFLVNLNMNLVSA